MVIISDNIGELGIKTGKFNNHNNSHLTGDIAYLLTPISPIRTTAKRTKQYLPSTHIRRKRKMNNQDYKNNTNLV